MTTVRGVPSRCNGRRWLRPLPRRWTGMALCPPIELMASDKGDALECGGGVARGAAMGRCPSSGRVGKSLHAIYLPA
jgi:hypothetical protein